MNNTYASENRKVPTTAYLFVHFTGNEESETDEQIYFALSRDGCHWTDTRENGDPVLTSDVGEHGVRDPFLIRAHDGTGFYLLATDLSIFHRGGWANGIPTIDGSSSIVIWESEDLVHWSKPRLADIAPSIPQCGMAWAPEAVWDDERHQYMVYWTTDSAAANLQGEIRNVYYVTTKDFVSFSKPVRWIDRKPGCIDTTMLKADDGWWYRVTGDGEMTIERTKNPYAPTTAAFARLEAGAGSEEWSYVGTLSQIFGDERFSGDFLEGPELFRFNDADIVRKNGKALKYGLMCDQYKEGKGYLPFRSADLSQADKSCWQQADDVDLGTLKKRHGGILPITEDEYRRIEVCVSSQR